MTNAMYYGNDTDAKQLNAAQYVPPPVPKRSKIKTCPATMCGVSCPGANCLRGPKGCIYRRLRADAVAGRSAIKAWLKEGYSI
jgi:hypothetical protein